MDTEYKLQYLASDEVKESIVAVKTIQGDLFEKYMLDFMLNVQIPCFDAVNITAEFDGQGSLLIDCKWKNKVLPCSELFSPFPTQMGTCCSFNQERAEKIIKSKMLINALAKQQKNNEKYSFKKEKKSQPIMMKPGTGIAAGLSVRLDSHYEVTELLTLPNNFNSFTVYLGSSSIKNPQYKMRSFKVLKGHNNLVGMSGTQVISDSSILGFDPIVRGCRLSTENFLSLFPVYTYSNCIFECSLYKAQRKAAEDNNLTISGTPWFFPRKDNDTIVSGY